MLLLTGVFAVSVLFKHPFQGHFLFSRRQHGLSPSILMYSNWSTIPGMWWKGPIPSYEKHPRIRMLAPPWFTVFTAYCHLNSVFGGRLTNCLWPQTQKEQSCFHLTTKMLQFMCSLANSNLFSTVVFPTMGLCGGFLQMSWLHIGVLWLFQCSQVTLDLWSPWSWSFAESLPSGLFFNPFVWWVSVFFHVFLVLVMEHLGSA